MKQELTEQEIGEKIQQLRKEKQLTLKKLAKQAGCTDATLSKIERGQMIPTISMLKKIVNAFNLTLTEFLSNGDDGDDDIITHENERMLLKFPHHEIYSQLMVKSQKGKKIQPLFEIIQPGFGSKGNYSHEGEEFGLVLEGELELTVNRKKYNLKAGDTFYFKSTNPHGFRNNGKEVVRLIWIITPPTY